MKLGELALQPGDNLGGIQRNGGIAGQHTGAFVIGVVYALSARYSSISNDICLLLATGLCGGFTTFSAFANEGLQMLQNGSVGMFFVYALTSVFAGVAMVALGWLAVR